MIFKILFQFFLGYTKIEVEGYYIEKKRRKQQRGQKGINYTRTPLLKILFILDSTPPQFYPETEALRKAVLKFLGRARPGRESCTLCSRRGKHLELRLGNLLRQGNPEAVSQAVRRQRYKHREQVYRFEPFVRK